MQEDEFRILADRLLAAVAHMDGRDERLVQQVPAVIEEQTSRWLRTVAGQVETAARSGLEPPLAAYQQRVQSLSAETEKAVATLQGARRDLMSVLRWVWIGACVSLLLSIVALVGTYEMLYGHYQTRYDELKSKVGYLGAINRSDVVPCGDGQLCARVDDKSPRYGEKKQYRVVEPRP
nr:hypothetical protein [Dyella sp. ASV24]